MNKTEYKGIRVTEDEATVLLLASKLTRQSMSSFIMTAVVEKCLRLKDELPEKQKQSMQNALEKMYSDS